MGFLQAVVQCILSVGPFGEHSVTLAEDNSNNRKAWLTTWKYALKHEQVQMKNVLIAINQNRRYAQAIKRYIAIVG